MKSQNILSDVRYRDQTTARFLEKHPDQAADVTLTRGEKIFYTAVLFILAGCIIADSVLSSRFLYLFYLLYFAIILFRVLTVVLALFGRPEIVITKAEIAAANEGEWPMYTVLVPLYREPEVAAKIVRSLDKLDYPREKLEVLLLLEQDDELTHSALARVKLPDHFRLIDVPDTLPRTKPKACNWGLKAAEGEFLVIYDAEDRPDPSQLKKSVLAFRKVPERVICLQAKLSYYNPRQNLLTRWFTIEYAAWFDLYLPGLYRLDFPIPLGGTSNHLRRRVLEEIGGWDPFNVAEDCDLGIRLHRMGYRTAMLDTTTWEEANSKLSNWVRQRSRWVKGYLQTHLVHTRKPLRTLRDIGPMGSVSFLLSVGGFSLVNLINPAMWIMAGIYFALAFRGIVQGGEPWQVISQPLHGISSIALGRIAAGGNFAQVLAAFLLSTAALLFLANFLFIFFNVLGSLRRKLGLGFFLVALISPFYWVLISAAGWKGFIQLLRRPHYWEKTDHGLFQETDGNLETGEESGNN